MAIRSAGLYRIYVDGFMALLEQDEVGKFVSAGRILHHDADTTLALQGAVNTHIEIILSGWVKLEVASPAGTKRLASLRGPGDIIGPVTLLPGEANTSSAVTVTNTITLAVPQSRLQRLTVDIPNLWPRLVQSLVKQMHEAEQLASIADASSPVSVRLARLMQWMSDRCGTPYPDGIELLPISQEELGSFLGASRPAVARALSHWRDRGVIDTHYRKIRIRDAVQLTRFADA